jgi:hypothetical protein
MRSRSAASRPKARRVTIGLVGTTLVVAACLMAPAPAAAQAGTLVVRASSAAGAPVPGALVTLLALRDSVVLRSETTDGGGRAALPAIEAGRYLLRGERLGFAATHLEVAVAAGRTTVADLVMAEAALGLPGVFVEAERRRARFQEAGGLTTRELTQRELKLIPAVGEADVLRAMEVLPGVVSTSDFSAAFNVRGGSADQNLILLDGLPVYNPFHLGGLFSVFSADMVARAELLAGGFPAEYGGRVASVLSVESDAGRPGFDAQAGVSVLAARIAAGTDVPAAVTDALGLQSARARLSVRRSYFDQLLKPFFDLPYHLTDVQGYAEAWLRGGSRITVTGYTGRDVLDLAGAGSFPLQLNWGWGNDVFGMSWVKALGAGGRLDVRAGHSRFATGIFFPEFDDTEFRGRIDQSLLRADLRTLSGPLALQLGAAADRLEYDNLALAGGTRFGGARERGWLHGVYGQAVLRHDEWLLEAGVRTDAWLPAGGRTAVVPQPRLAVKRFLGAGNFAVKLAAGRYSQFVHSLRDEDLPLGIDVWVLAGERAPHVVSDQAQLGVEGYFGDSWFGGAEAYHRSFRGVTAVNPADDPNDPADDLLAGTGASYGADFHLRRESGRIRPMLAVSWLRAWREFADPYAAAEPPPTLRYAPVFDRRVNVDLLVQAVLRHDVELGVRWNLGTGLPFTRPAGAHVYYDYSLLEGGWRFQSAEKDTARSAIVQGQRNTERYPPYHRLDAGLRRTYHRAWGSLTLNFDVINVYNRRNVLFYFYQYGTTPPTRAGISMFPVLPTIGAEARF